MLLLLYIIFPSHYFSKTYGVNNHFVSLTSHSCWVPIIQLLVLIQLGSQQLFYVCVSTRAGTIWLRCYCTPRTWIGPGRRATSELVPLGGSGWPTVMVFLLSSHVHHRGTLVTESAPEVLWVISCFLRIPVLLKHFPQSLQEYGFCPVWVLLCLTKVPDWLKLFPHSLQEYGFSPVWVLTWDSRWLRFPNCFLQVLHENSFSPVWVRLCVTKFPLRLKCFPHSEQGKGFSPVWVRRWRLNVSVLLNHFPHCWQEYGWRHGAPGSPSCWNISHSLRSRMVSPQCESWRGTPGSCYTQTVSHTGCRNTALHPGALLLVSRFMWTHVLPPPVAATRSATIAPQ